MLNTFSQGRKKLCRGDLHPVGYGSECSRFRLHSSRLPYGLCKNGLLCDKLIFQSLTVENFYGGFYQCQMEVICVWCSLFVTYNLTLCSCFLTNVLSKFVDIIRIFFYTHAPWFICHGIGVRECLFLGMQKIWSHFSQIKYKQQVLMSRLKRTTVSKSRYLHA